jgi:hypothetical protein
VSIRRLMVTFLDDVDIESRGVFSNDVGPEDAAAS